MKTDGVSAVLKALCSAPLPPEMMDYMERLQVLREIVKKFPPVNYQVFKYIITHLNR